jgi:hypothetical protein
MKMENISFLRTVASTNQPTQRFNPKEHDQNLNRLKVSNLKTATYVGLPRRIVIRWDCYKLTAGINLQISSFLP